jgi:hypothetical protein
MTDDGERAWEMDENGAIACPFCGYLGTSIYFRPGVGQAASITGDGTWVIECNTCQCEGPIRLGRDNWGQRIRPMLIEAWNNQKANKRCQQAEAERERAWIACSEREPADGTEAICSHRGQVFVGIYSAKNGWAWEHQFTDVTHWMPLPKPPRAEGAAGGGT